MIENEKKQDKRIIVIPAELLERVNVKSPAKWFIIDAMGNKETFYTVCVRIIPMK